MNIKQKVEQEVRKILNYISSSERKLVEIQNKTESIIYQAKLEAEATFKQLKKEQAEIKRERANIEKENRLLDKKEEALNALVDSYETISPKIAKAYADFLFTIDKKSVEYYLTQKPSAIKATLEIAEKNKELRVLRRQNKEYEYLLAELWDDDEIEEETEDFEQADEVEDTAKFFLSKNEYQNLSDTEKNQLALDRYLSKNHSKSHIGKMYERYIGYLYENEGYKVEYRGIKLGKEDGGIDLIAKRGNETLVIQCKCWKKEATIYEKHICQLYGALSYYKTIRYVPYIKAVFVTTTQLGDEALRIANNLNIAVAHIELSKDYPMIKCNVNNGNKIYHLPFDQQYDNTQIYKTEECYVKTIVEAEQLGFRRAHRCIVTM